VLCVGWQKEDQGRGKDTDGFLENNKKPFTQACLLWMEGILKSILRDRMGEIAEDLP
jgi:hypothetical protein